MLALRDCFVAALLAMTILIPATFAEPIRFELEGEKIEIQTGDQIWTEGLRDNAGNKGLVEYFLPEEKPESWTEVIMVNYFKEMKGDDLLERFMSFTREGLHKQCTQVQWEDLADKPDGKIYTWSARNCKDWPDQTEVARVIIGKQGLYVLHYATKEVPMPEKKRETWHDLFSEAKVTAPA